MSLVLTALRLQAVAALNAHPVIAGLCEGRVYDSRIDDFDHREPVPVIVVTTEAVEGEGWSENNGGAPFDDTCRLVLEIAMNCLVAAPTGDPENPEELSIAAPATDRELEAVLNLIEDCAETVLTLGLAHPLDRQRLPEGALLMRAVTRRVKKRSIERFSSDKTGERLAIHLVTYQVELKGDDWDASVERTGAYAALPEPLRLVCEAAAPGTSARQTCDLIAAQIAMPDLSRLASVSFAPSEPLRPGQTPIAAEEFPSDEPPAEPVFDPEPPTVSG
ncbi:hypothetical protein [Hansschlegelia zhihuaiae]|uniref:Uncharacterized protein n=1 Tax=Hansschlegelia zhihuaiae TaxID=405005 RepID=A0A4Q0M4Q0_9HYPH|nr:hypothetical protein [Hansschlegelia zhihuaiae]RXF67689.1 hypothetical protein EK403_21030 [Hansschlegelia zhihuaiae]